MTLFAPPARDGLIAALRNVNRGVLDAIHWMKQFYTEQRMQGWPLPPNTCSILTCFDPGSFVMNGLSYCATHSGLAVINGLRHGPPVNQRPFCDACRVWNAVVLRPTMSDEGHIHMAVKTLRVPDDESLRAKPTQTHPNPTVRSAFAPAPDPNQMHLEYFIPDVRPRLLTGAYVWNVYRAFRFHGRGQPALRYLDAQRRPAVVPRDAWYVPENPPGRGAAAWIRLATRNPINGRMEPVVQQVAFLDIMAYLDTTESGLALGVLWGGPPAMG